MAFRLQQLGLPEDTARRACCVLEPEKERAVRIVEARGRSSKTATYLVRHGFAADSVEDAVGMSLADAAAEGYDNLSSSDIFPA